QTMIDVDALETDEDPQPKQVDKGIGRRLRSKRPKPTSSAKVTPSVTKKAKENAMKPVRYDAKKGWSKVVPPSEKKKNVLK
ncbi:hypothetical protein A2U01_0091712, partial [Trifolium medium]|nr:hypothetical protein [Trifolium medium]